MTPLVSVIMPAFNAKDTIAEAIASAFDDEQVPVEILVADDGSDDGTPEHVASMGDDRIRVVRTGGRKLGANAGRNVALDSATGEWVAFLDPDDTWLPGRLATLLDVADRTGAEWLADDILVVQVNSDLVETGRTTVFSERGLDVDESRELGLVDLIRYDLGVVQPMIKRKLVEEPRIRFPKPATSDFTFLFWSLDAAGRATVIEDALYRYNKVEGTATMSHASPAFWLDSVESTAQLLADAQGHDRPVVAALERRLRQSTRKYHYLQMRRDLASGRIGAASARAARNPSALVPAFEALAGSVGDRTSAWRKR